MPSLMWSRQTFEKQVLSTTFESGLTTRVCSVDTGLSACFLFSGWAASVAYMNAANNMVLRAMVNQAKLKDFEMDFDELDEHYDTSKVKSET